MAKLLLGKEVTAAMNEKLQARVAALKEKGVSPKLAIVRCGENPSDLSYEKGATARAELIGVEVQKFVLPEDVATMRFVIDTLMPQIADLRARRIVWLRSQGLCWKSVAKEVGLTESQAKRVFGKTIAGF